jgi:transcriptional regulator with XRE-family HTH domain
MATATRRPRTLFGEILRQELDSQGVSIRELARRLTADEPEKIENTRRTLIRYMQGEVQPGVQAREAIAEALSIDPQVFADDADRAAKRERVLDALAPLADVLLELAIEIRDGR